MQKRARNRSIQQMYKTWLHGSSRRSQFGISILTILFYGMWEIWKIRCNIKFGDERFNSTQLVRMVYTHLQDINRIHQPKRKPTTFEKICLQYLELEVRDVVEKKGKWFCWNKPEQHMFKLNVDGAYKGHAAAGSGVVRDRRGEFICGYAAPYEPSDVIAAELQALYDGMRLCMAKGITGVCIEADAAMVVDMVKGDKQDYWRYTYQVRKVKALLPYFDSINHIVREQNMVADSLAKSALDASGKNEFTSIQNVPRHIQQLIFLDRIGIPNFLSPCI